MSIFEQNLFEPEQEFNENRGDTCLRTYWHIYFSVSYAQQDPDSQQFKQITDGEFKHIHLHRFPDSKQLITSIMKEQVLIGFGIIQNESGEVNRVQIGDGFSGDFYTTISPDGKWVLFDARKGRTGINIWRVGVHGGSPEQITQDGGQMPSWSPDGSKIAFSSDRNGNLEVWTVEVKLR